MMFSFDYVKVLLPFIAVGAGYAIGYSSANSKCTIKTQENVIVQEQANNEALTATAFIDKKIQNEVYHVTEDLYLSLADVDNEYSLMRSAPVINSFGGLSINFTSKDNPELSDTTKTTGGISEDESRQLKDNARKLQKLYEAELEKSRKCDMAIVKLNNLIDFYSKVYTTYNE